MYKIVLKRCSLKHTAVFCKQFALSHNNTSLKIGKNAPIQRIPTESDKTLSGNYIQNYREGDQHRTQL